MSGSPHLCTPRFVCVCLKLTKADLVQAIREKRLASIEEVVQATKAGAECKSCLRGVARSLQRELEPNALRRIWAATPTKAAATGTDFIG